jgi:hypothetical protein
MVVKFYQFVRPIVENFFQCEIQKAGVKSIVFCVAVVNKLLEFRHRFTLDNRISVMVLFRVALRFGTVPGQNHFAIDPELKSWSTVNSNDNSAKFSFCFITEIFIIDRIYRVIYFTNDFYLLKEKYDWLAEY